MKNCDRGLENAARGRRSRAAFSFSSPREFRPLTSQEKKKIGSLSTVLLV